MPRFDVSPAAPHELLPACRLLFADGRAEAGRDRLVSGGEASGLFVARAGGRVRAAALVQALPGALGVAWPPRGDSREAEDAATAAACAWLRAQGVKVCQAFAAESEASGMAPLEAAGFRRTTELIFLRRNIPRGGWFLLRPPHPMTLTPESPPLSAEFIASLLATHEGTLDCPELNATRTPAEVLAGFATSTSSRWCRADDGENRIGVFTFEINPVRDAAGELSTELTYIGVVPGARGRGFGADLLNYAMAAAGLEGVAVLNVSVDARNTPAMRLYARHKFAEYDRRGVWLAAWPG